MPARRRRPLASLRLAVIGVGVGIGVGVAIGLPSDQRGSDRQSWVAERGARVMPFDLDKTRHRFAATEAGGVQAVVAMDPADSDEIAEIRRHLRKEATAFARGDLSDPAAIHGRSMPGLQTLQRNSDALRVTYAERRDGAEVRFRSDVPAVVDALHSWFKAQLSDHGSHAEQSS